MSLNIFYEKKENVVIAYLSFKDLLLFLRLRWLGGSCVCLLRSSCENPVLRSCLVDSFRSSCRLLLFGPLLIALRPLETVAAVVGGRGLFCRCGLLLGLLQLRPLGGQRTVVEGGDAVSSLRIAGEGSHGILRPPVNRPSYSTAAIEKPMD